MFQYCGCFRCARDVGTQNMIRKKCLISLECTSDLAFQMLFTCRYTVMLCNFHFFKSYTYILLVYNGSSRLLIWERARDSSSQDDNYEET